MKDEQEQREVLALVSWLQTFEEFPYSVVDGADVENVQERATIVLESLENIKISSSVVKITEKICNIEKIGIGPEPTAENIWRTLLHVATVKSRFEIYTTPSNVTSNLEIPHVVLSNLLDFAVTSQDLEDRRRYIESIMTLTKAEQRILMSIIDRMKKTLPRKPKSTSATPGPKAKKSMRARSPRVMCHKSNRDTEEGLDASASEAKQPTEDGYQTPEEGENELLLPDDSQRSGSTSKGFSTPKRERNIHGIPQTEPPRRKSTSENRYRTDFRGDKRNSKNNLLNRYQCRERKQHQPEFDEQPQDIQSPRQPEGRYLSQSPKKRSCHKGFSSPPKDHQRKQKGFASPGKLRKSFGGKGSLPLPACGGRQGRSERAAFSSVNNQESIDYQSSIASNKGVAFESSPPPPPPPYPAPSMSSEQVLPSSATPSDEMTDFGQHMSLPLKKTDTTMSTAADSASRANSDLGIHSISSSENSQQSSVNVVLNALEKSLPEEKNSLSSPMRNRSLLDSPGAPETPERSMSMYDGNIGARMMFSPDESVLQSPMQMDDFVRDLRSKNKSLEGILQSYQKRERELSQKMESTESKLRKEMMKLESRALGREDELRNNYEQEVAKLKKELRTEKESNRESQRAKEELANANDELDLMQHTHEKLLEATEKIRKYKERLDSMNDFKEALQREQDAHSKSVDECVRLQNELNILLPLKRQLEDYKNKAVETEIQLAECKDALARLERERDALDGARDEVMKEAKTQRAQADELRNFIRVEESQDAVPSIGEGISELNPELHEELVKLRNENKRLNKFAEERTDDSVQRLHEDLEDSNQRQERFKQEYLKSKNSLENTESLLEEAKQKLAELEVDIEEKDKKAEEYEKRLATLEDHFASCLEDLEGLQEQIEEVEGQKAVLQSELLAWKEMADKLETELKNRSSDLENTRTELQETEALKVQVETSLAEWKLMAEKLESELQRRANELEETTQTLGTTQEEKSKVESDLAEWKKMFEKLDEELARRNEELDSNRQQLEAMEEEKTKLVDDLDEFKQLSDKLDAELKSRVADLDETKKQLQETEEMLHDSGKRQEDLLNQIDVYEKQLADVTEEKEITSKDLLETQQALTTAEIKLRESESREEILNEESRELKEVSEQLVNQLREEKAAKKSLMEESHKSLEATREVLNSKSKKDLEELQANMNQLLNDERKAYRLKAEKASVDFKKLDEGYKKKLQDTKNEASASMKALEEDYERKLNDLREQAKKDVERVKKEEDAQRKKLIETGEAYIEEAKVKMTAALQEEADRNAELAEALDEKEDQYQQQKSKNTTLKKRLEHEMHKINNLESEQDDLQEDMKKLEREKAKLEEETERYRRQLGGRYGADGTMQNQLDKINKELMDAHNENKMLKQKLEQTFSDDINMSTSFEADQSHGYSRGGVHTSTLTQIKADFQEQISNLHDEKRELVMKNSAAIRDVQNAENVAWEREQEISKMKEEMTSLKLQLQRAELVVEADENADASFYNVRDASFATGDLSFTQKNAENHSFLEEKRQANLSTNTKAPTALSTTDNNRVLTPSGKHENTKNMFSGSTESNSSPRHAVSKPNPQQLQLQDVNTKSSRQQSALHEEEEKRNIVDFTQAPVEAAGPDGESECTQS